MATLQFSEGTDVPMAIHQRKQLLPNIVDGMARTRPEAIYAETSVSPTTYDKRYLKITYRALANAVNGVAWLLRDRLGEGTNHDTVAYIGPNDLAYVFMILGASKAGYKILSVSPRNTIADHISLFEATDCNILLTPSAPYSATVTGILENYPLKIVHSPSLYELLESNYPPYPYRKTFAEARLEPLVALHTSGTTGTPKPIIYTHDFAASYSIWGRLHPPPGFQNQMMLVQSSRLFVTPPFFHAGNLFATLFDALANQTTIVTPLSGAIPSAELVVEGLRHTQVESLLLIPPILEKVASSQDMLDYIAKRVRVVFYGGGSISQSAGDAFSAKTQIFNMNGSTETTVFPTICQSGRWPSEDWSYINPHPDAGIEFRAAAAADGGVFEAIIVRNAKSGDEQPVFKIFPDLTEYPTKDLFVPHPLKPNLWKHQGRKDDTIVFKAGYMCNPVALEQRVSQHPEVRAALMTGTGRFQPALLIEPADDQRLSTEAKKALVERLWPVVQEANDSYKLGARISKTHILVLNHEQPMRYAGKGTVQRAPTLSLYETVLDDLYAREGDVPPNNDLALPVSGYAVTSNSDVVTGARLNGA